MTKNRKVTIENFPGFIRNIKKEYSLTSKGLSKLFDNEISHRTIEGWQHGKPPAPGMIPMINLMLDR